MSAPLHLQVTDYESEERWRWVLNDARGTFLADHEVDLADDASPEVRAFRDLPAYLAHHKEITPPGEILARVGAWMGEKVFGDVAARLAGQLTPPATVVRLAVPAEAQGLLARPFELAHLPAPEGAGAGSGGASTGRPLAEAGVRFVYQLDDAPEPKAPKPAGDTLRVLALFSLPHGANPLSLRRERVELEGLLRRLAQSRSLGLELRVLQYGATRAIFRQALQEAAGWDLIHISGHGLEGELALEDDEGRVDRVGADELAPLLEPAKERLRLLTLSTCLSGAASVAAARRQVGLDDPPRRQTQASAAAAPATEGEAAAAVAAGLPVAAALPSLGQSLARELDRAVLAMRYSVGDDFARALCLGLYDKLLDKGQPLPAALQLALDEALAGSAKAAEALPLSPATPILFGPRAAGLTLSAPRAAVSFELPRTGLMGFPPPPERFVGRVRPMLRASAALAPAAAERGVLFYGMAGGGKTACALELAWRHEQGRFQGMAWWKAPDEDQDVSGALTSFALALERQLPGLALVGLVDDPETLKHQVVPGLKALLRSRALLLVLDNLESLLTSRDAWRDPRWGDLLLGLLDHDGTSRVVLTSRRVPADLAAHPRLRREPIHALSFPESVLLARELPALSRLFGSEEGQERLRRVLAAAQGHPKLLELADGLAGRNPEELERQLGRSEERSEERGEAEERRSERSAGAPFFTQGESERELSEYVGELAAWTAGVSAGLPPTARLLFGFLCCLEEADRVSGIVEPVWPHFLARLGDGVPAAAAALAESGQGLEAALARLADAGLVEVERVPGEAGKPEDGPRLLRLHPAVAEAGRAEAGATVAAAVDRELGDFWVAMFQQARKTEMQGAGGRIAAAGPRAAPYLLRGERWGEAGLLLGHALARDQTPATVATALPLLRRVAAATEGTERALIDAGKLASALMQAGRLAEAEQRLRELIDKAEEQNAWRLASPAASELLNLLLATGRAGEALPVAERMAEFTRRAGLGPWTQLAGENMHLQLLNALGRWREVLDAVERLRPEMAELPEEGEAEEAVHPWNVREGLLNIGCEAAQRLEDWPAALELNAEIYQITRDRGAGEAELAATRFNDYGPLLRLRRFGEARALLEACRRVFESEGQIGYLGKVLSALADLEDKKGDSAGAAQFEAVALRYRYQVGDPEDCAISHNNRANYLQRSGAAEEEVLAQRLAAASIWLQSGSGQLAIVLGNLARSPLPPAPPLFDEVADRVEAMEGVRFRDLFARLPRRAPDGDAALAEVWRLVEAERPRIEAQQQQAERLKEGLEAVSPEIAAAFASGDPVQLQAALEALSPEERQAVMTRLEEALREAGIEAKPPTGPDMEKVLRELDPLLRGIAAVARGDDEAREAIEAVLPQLEDNGWRLTEAVGRIWAGERDAEALTAGVDPNSAQLVHRILELLDQLEPEGAEG